MAGAGAAVIKQKQREGACSISNRSSTSHDFSGQLVVVTGGAQGIGGAVVDRLHQSGATVAI